MSDFGEAAKVARANRDENLGLWKIVIGGCATLGAARVIFEMPELSVRGLALGVVGLSGTVISQGLEDYRGALDYSAPKVAAETPVVTQGLSLTS